MVTRRPDKAANGLLVNFAARWERNSAMNRLAGVVEKLRSLSPTMLISNRMPPFLFIHGDADEQVPYEQSPKMCQAMRKAGAKCEVITVAGGRHGMGSWEKNPGMAHWKSEMIEWLKNTFKK